MTAASAHSSHSLDDLDRHLLSDFQQDFPLTTRPYAELALRLGVDEETVLARLERLRDDGVVARVGAVIRPNMAGAGTLAAMSVPPERLEAVAALVSARREVNHNYRRDHAFNLWFVITADDRAGVDATLDAIRAATGLAVLDLPMEEEFHIDLGFPLPWEDGSWS